MEALKNKIITRIKANFADAKETNDFNYNRVDFSVKKETIPSILAYLKDNIQFSKRRSWVRHDEHYHVDFAIPCKHS